MNLRKDMTALIQRRFARLLAIVCSGLSLLVPLQGLQADVDIRRDAVVDAIKDVMPSVVNVRTESYVEASDPFEAFRAPVRGPSTPPCSGLGLVFSGGLFFGDNSPRAHPSPPRPGKIIRWT